MKILYKNSIKLDTREWIYEWQSTYQDQDSDLDLSGQFHLLIVSLTVNIERKSEMPTISNFFGMSVKMYFQQAEHNPPHFHVIYGEFVGVIEIESLSMIEGDLPGKALTLVQEWAELYKEELLLIWNTQSFKKLPPLV